MVTENSELVTFGGTAANAVTFRGARLTPNTFQQAYQGFRTGPGADRSSLTDLTKVKISDFSAGLDPTPGIKSWLRDLNKFSYNEGLQTRLPGLCVLPFDLVNQTSITSDEDVSSAIASGWRAHVVVTSLGDTESRYYVGIGHKVFRNVGNGNSALEVCYTTTTGYITAMAVLNVDGTPRLCVATTDADDDVFYVSDPTGTWSGNTTVLVALTDGDWITGMQYFPTLGSGTNVIVGTIGGTPGVYWMDISTSAPWTMKNLVTAVSKDQYNPDNTVLNTGAIFPFTETSLQGWVNLSNLEANDGSNATLTVAGAGTTTGQFVAWFDLRPYLPASGWAPVGMEISYERSESGSTANASTNVMVLVSEVTYDIASADETFVEMGRDLSGGGEWPTTPTVRTVGASDDLLGANPTIDDWLSAIGVYMDVDVSDNQTASIDYMTMTAYYREFGSMVSFTSGGWMVSPNPAFPERMAIVVPATKNDIGAITEPRVMWFLDFQWETAQERPVMTYSRPNTGLNYVHHAAPFQGGWSVTGNNAAGPGVSLKHVDSNGNLRDFACPAHNGVEEYRVNAMYPQGSWLVLDMVAQDYSDRQWWFYNNGRFFPDTILQSLSDGLDIAAQPIPFSTVGIDLENDVIYSLFPNGTDLGVARQFLPPDLGLDPRIVFADKVKTQASRSTTEDSPLRLHSVELDIGPEEANKALVVAEYLGRRISAGTGAAYGSVHLDIVTDADTTFASPDVTYEFTTAFEQYDIPQAGVAFRSVVLRIGLEHDVNEDETPDGLPILLTSVQDWPHERTYVFELRELITPDNIFAFMDQLEALADTAQSGKVVQPLDMANIPNQPAKFDRYLIPTEGLVLPPRSVQPAPSHFIDARGNEVFIGLMFHTVPGTGE